MTLEGAKFICLDEAGNHGEVVLAKGRKFTMGYYVNCDYILVDERAKGVHCEIECDAFGRVTIRNLSPDKPILVNGSSVEIKRILLNNSKLTILDKEYLWFFPKNSSNEFEDLPIQDSTTPQKLVGIPEQPPNSCPDFKLHRDLPKRFTVHNFAYCIQSDEEGNTSSESNNEDDNENGETSKSQVEKKSEIHTLQLIEKDSKDDTSQEKNSDREKENRYRCTTPNSNEQMIKTTTEPFETPNINLINSTKDKENSCTENKNMQLLKMCHQSDIVITSFSPRETGVKICKSFAAVIKPKVLVTKTPKSVYSTPTSDMNENVQDDLNQSDLMAFYTPSTSKKVTGGVTALPTSIKVLKNSSMHLIDLTTPPIKLKPTSPYLKPNLKDSVKKNVSINIDKPSTKEKLGLNALPATPASNNVSNTPRETSSSVISINSSEENSSIIEVTSDGSHMGLTPNVSTDRNAPLKMATRVGACTPKRTPQSLMKRAILTSAKKQNTTPLMNMQNPGTPRREAINRIPLRSNLAWSKTPVTPKVLTGSSRRQSMSTPIRNSAIEKRFDHSPSTSNIISCSSSTSATTSSRRSSINPISAAKALPTSTPVSTKCVALNRVSCKTSPLHKVRKSYGGIPLSSHITRARRSTVLSASSSKIISIKEKSPQQVMSDRIVNRARKSIFSRSHNLVEAAKKPPQSTSHSNINKEKANMATTTPDCKAVLFVSKNTEDDNETDLLSRTFILDSSEDENVGLRKDATFSPDKYSMEKMSTTDKTEEKQAIEIPVDAEEVLDLCNENKEKTNQINNEGNNMVEPCHEEKESVAVKEDNLKHETDNSADAKRIKEIVSEESFAEEINASVKQPSSSVITDSSQSAMSSQTEQQTCLADIQNKDATYELGQETSIKNDRLDHSNVTDTGFGEESRVEVCQKSTSKMPLKESRIGSQISRPDMLEDETKSEFEKVLLTEAENESKSTVAQVAEASKIETKVAAQNLDEYKPIVEDITIEGSLSEKEANDNADKNVNEQLYKDINFKVSLTEEKVKSEEMKEEVIKIAIEESEDKEQISARCKNSELSACSETMKQTTNTDVANIILATEEISTDAKEKKEETFEAESEIAEKSLSIPIDMDFVFTNQCAKNVEVKNETTKTPLLQKELQSVQTQEHGSEQKNLQVSQPEQSKIVQDAETVAKPQLILNYESQIEENLDDTNKLLEEIEDVLNKSDEFKQKQLNELEQSCDKPLTEEFESEQFSQEKVQEINELQETGNLLQTVNASEFSSSVPSSDKTTNENIKKHIPADITAGISSAKEKNHLNISVSRTLIQNAISTDLNTSELQGTLQNRTTNENISKQSESSVDDMAAENTQHNDRISDVQIPGSKSLGNEPATATKSDEKILNQIESNDGAVAATNIQVNDKISDVQDLDSKSLENESTASKSNISSNIVTEVDGNFKQIKVLNKNAENISNFTPRRSTRRASQSSDAVQITPKLTFTPRRSTRRSSMSAETLTTATTLTPVKRTTRRASLSTFTDTPLTPKPITKRRASISLEDETLRPSASKLHQRAKTPRKQLELNMIIPEENFEIYNVIKQDAVVEQERIQFEEKRDSKSRDIEEETGQCVENEESNKAEVILELTTACQKDLTKTTTKLTEESIEKSLECNIVQEHFAKSLEKLLHEVPTNTEESSACNTNADEEQCEEIPPKQPEKIKNENISSTEEKLSEYQQNKVIEPTDSSKGSITTEQSVDDDHVINANSPGAFKELVHSPNMPADKGELADVMNTANSETASETLDIEVSPKNTKRAKILGDSPKTRVRDVLKTPKPATQTPRIAGIRNLIRTPKHVEENETEEMEKLAVVSDLVKTPEILTPKVKKHVTITAESPKTPLFTGVPQLLKTPKAEPNTPKFAGIRDLMKTPKLSPENETEELDKLAMMAALLKTPECSKIIEGTPSSSLKGVKELLKTPKHLITPQFRGMRKLLKTPKERATPNTTGVKELLESPVSQTCEDIPVSDVEIEDTNTLPEDFPSSTSQSPTNLKKVKELPKTPKSCSTPRRTGLGELMNTPKTGSTPALGGNKGLMGDITTVQQKDKDLEMFLRTPSAKNIMISSLPSSAVIEKSIDSIEISTEYDLNATNEPEAANLGELFKTPGATCFEERIASSYYDGDKAGGEETLQDELNKTAEEAFDKLIGQESQIQTPIRKRYTRKSFALQTPTCSSPFTAAEILSDLPKTDVEDWIESLDQAEPPTLIESEDDAPPETNEELDRNTIDTFENTSIKKEQNQILNESIIPETCAKIFIAEKSDQGNKSSTSSTYVDTKDPLLNTYVELKEALSPITLTDAEISGINLLDQTIDSAQDEASMLDEPLFVDEPSMFDEPLIVSDYESEGERSLNFSNIETSQDDGNNDLAEPLLLSDSDNLSQDSDINNQSFENEPAATETKHNTNIQEKSMLENLSTKIELLADDPLEIEHKKTVAEEQNTVTKIVVNENEASSEEQNTIIKIDLTENEASSEEQSTLIENEAFSEEQNIIIKNESSSEEQNTIFKIDVTKNEASSEEQNTIIEIDITENEASSEEQSTIIKIDVTKNEGSSEEQNTITKIDVTKNEAFSEEQSTLIENEVSTEEKNTIIEIEASSEEENTVLKIDVIKNEACSKEQSCLIENRASIEEKNTIIEIDTTENEASAEEQSNLIENEAISEEQNTIFKIDVTKNEASSEEQSTLIENEASSEEQNTIIEIDTTENEASAEEQSNLIENDVAENETDCLDKSLDNAEAVVYNSTNNTVALLNKETTAIFPKKEQKSFVEIVLPQEASEEISHLLINTDNVFQEISEKQESEAMEASKTPPTSQIDSTENELVFNANISSTFENIDAEVDAAETLSDPTVYEANFEKSPAKNIESKAVAIEQIKIGSAEFEDVLVDTSATDICEETNSPNEEETEISQKISKKKANDECQDIFMDNSNIDESFADEAINEENNSALSETITKISIEEQNVFCSTEIEKENETDVVTVKSCNEETLSEQTNTGIETEEEADVDTAKVSMESTLYNQTSNQTDSKDYEQSNTDYKDSENSQFNTISRKTSQIEKLISDITPIESTVETTVSEIEPLIKEIVESQSNQRLESGTTTPVQVSTVNLDTTLPDAHLNEDEQKLESRSEVIDKTIGEASHVISETKERSVTEHEMACEAEEAGESISTSIKESSNEVSTNEFASIPIEDLDSVDFNDVTNSNDDKNKYDQSRETIATKSSESGEEQKIGGVILTREEISNISEESPQTLEETGEKTEILHGKEYESSIKYEETVAIEEVTSETNIEVSMKQISSDGTFLEESINTTTEIVKYDFEIKINARQGLKEGEVKRKEVATTSSHIECPQKNEVIHEIIPSTVGQSHKTAEIFENSPAESSDIVNIFEEIIQEDVKTNRKNNTVAEDILESSEGGEMNKNSRKDRHKVTELPADEKYVEIVEDTISDIAKVGERSKKKRNTSESSHGSVTDNDAGCTTRTRKGDRRKIEKNSQEAVLEEQPAEEIIIFKQLEDKTCKETNPIETDTECKESDDTINIKIINEAQKQKGNDFIATEEEITPEQKLASSKSEKTVSESDNQGAAVAETQVASSEPLVEQLIVAGQDNMNSSVSVKHHVYRVGENKIENSNETPTRFLENIVERQVTPSEVSKMEKPYFPALSDGQSVGNKNTQKSKLSIEIETPEQTLSAVTDQEEIAEATVTETEQLPSKRLRSKPTTVLASSRDDVGQKENTRTRRNASKFQKETVGVKKEEPQENEECTSAEIINNAEKISVESAPSHSVENTKFKLEEQIHRRNRRNANLSESSQDSQLEDGNTRSRRNRRKIQKSPVEEAVAEESKEGEIVVLTEIKNDTNKINTITEENTEARQDLVRKDKSPNLDVDKNAMTNIISDRIDSVLSEAKETPKAVSLHHCGEQTSEVTTVSLEVVQATQKRTRRKITISESSLENDTSRPRRGGRKVQKAIIEEIHIEEDYEVSQSELNKKEDPIAKNTAVDVKDSKVLVNNQEISATTAETEESNKQESELKKESLEQVSDAPVKVPIEHEAAQQTVSRRRKNKPILQEEQTTSRRGRRKVVVSATDSATAEVKTPQVETERVGEYVNVINNDEDPIEEKMTTNAERSPNKAGKRGKQHKVDVKKLVSNEDDVSPKSAEFSNEPSEKETFTKQTTKRRRQHKVDDIKESVNTEKAPTIASTTRRGVRHNKETAENVASSSVHKGRNTNRNRKTPIEHITGDSQIEEICLGWKSVDKRPTTPSIITIAKVMEETKDTNNTTVLEDGLNENEKSLREEEFKSVKKPVKRTHSPPDSIQVVNKKPVKQLKHGMLNVEKSNEKGIDSDLENSSLEQKTDNKNVKDEQKQEVEKDSEIRPQKSMKSRVAAKHEQHDKHYEEPSPKPRRRKVAEEVVVEPKNVDVKITEVNPAPEEHLGKQISAQEENHGAKVKKSRTKATAGQIEHNHNESSASVRRRAARTKQVFGDQDTEETQVTSAEASKIEHTPEDEITSHKKKRDTEEESNQTKSGESGSRRRNVVKKTVENKDIQHVEENAKEDNEPTDTDKKQSQENKLDENVKGRSRKKKIDYNEESIEPAASYSPVTKSRSRKRKEINADVNDEISKQKEQASVNTEKQPQETPGHSAPTTKKGLKVIEHITAESQETDDTPGRRARNVPQRKAATAYHNYDETSDSEITSKAKKKPDTPRKSLETTKKSPIATIASAPAPLVRVSPSHSSVTPIITARGRTRKPTAKVQQYLEEERAKAETPKKRALLAVAAANIDGTTPQRTPVRRGRKVSTIEIDVDGTPQAGKGRGRGKTVAIQAQKEEPIDLPAATTAATEEKNIELLATATTQSSTKLRLGGRKAKITDGESHITGDEPPAKKPPLEVENEKQHEASPSSDHPTPTRTAGRRNAAAAAKARIEEDALAAAAIEPPKRVRVKKAPQKVSTQLVTSTDTDKPSTTEAEEELNNKTEKEVKNKNYSSKKTEHRLASASTIEGAEDLQVDNETDTGDKTIAKRARKPAEITTANSPAVPAKRARKAKIAEKVADPQTSVESKTARGRGRGRKNVHFDELEADASSSQQNETDVEAAPAENSEPIKRGTRTRRK